MKLNFFSFRSIFLFSLIIVRLSSSVAQMTYKGITYGKEKFDRGIFVNQISDGNMLSVGYSTSFSKNGDEDYYIIKTDVKGNRLWEKVLGGPKSDIAFGFVELARKAF